ncbi:MAG: NAD-dependent epimerase/dehydratase family protein [Candidatus Lokiarchaeia archaeon]
MKALVTGATGFIGKHLVRELTRRGNEVVGFDKKQGTIATEFVQGDIVSFNFDEILDDVDVVFHLAGLLGTTELFHRIIEAEKVNVLGTLNLLESMRRNGVEKIVFTSKPNVWKYNVYTITKENCERYLEMYREIYGFKPVITRPFNVYGPEEYLIEYRKAVPYFIVTALRNEPIEVFGDGEQTMDVIYVDDAAKALIKCAEKVPKETVEIGTSEPIKVKDLAEKIVKLTNSESEITYKPMRKGETNPKYICAKGNMEQLIGFKPITNLEEGMSITIKWYKEHLDEFKEIYKFKEEDFG